MDCQGYACLRLTFRLVRWLPVCFVLLLQAWTYYVYVYYFCFGFTSNFAQRVVYLTIFNIIYALATWSYVQTMFTDVLHPPENFAVSTEVHDNYCVLVNEPAHQRAILEEFVQHNQIQVLTRINNNIRYCVTCRSIKPDRAHHCSCCNRCILRMDHHCPWLNACVGYGNYKGFLLVLFYGLIVCSFIFATCLPVYVGFFAGRLNDDDFDGGRLALANVLTLFFVAGLFMMPMLGMIRDHLDLLTHNRTTIECLQKVRFADGSALNAYDLGRMQNVRQVFGETVLLWPLPIPTQLGNGVIYPRRDGSEKSSRR